MRLSRLFVYMLPALWGITGCEAPAPNSSADAASPLGRLKVSDLQDSTKNEVPSDFLLSFRVLTYTIDPGNVDKLNGIYARLSRSDVRMVDSSAFNANGFAAGTASFQTGAEIAQELIRIGAVRTSQTSLMIPLDKSDPLSRLPLRGGETIHYIESIGNSATIVTPGPGLLGWVMSANPDPRFRGLAQVRLFPAFWQKGFEDIRFRMGLEPIEYNPIVAGQVLMRVEETGVIVLGPTRQMTDEITLDKTLFYLPGKRPKIQLFVIICDSVGM